MKEYIKIFTGMSILTNRLKSILENENIPSIIKDEQESGRLAGFGTPINSSQLFVLNSDLDKASKLAEEFQKEIED